MKILSSFSQVVPNLNEFLSAIEHKRRYFEECWRYPLTSIVWKKILSQLFLRNIFFSRTNSHRIGTWDSRETVNDDTVFIFGRSFLKPVFCSFHVRLVLTLWRRSGENSRPTTKRVKNTPSSPNVSTWTIDCRRSRKHTITHSGGQNHYNTSVSSS